MRPVQVRRLGDVNAILALAHLGQLSSAILSIAYSCFVSARGPGTRPGATGGRLAALMHEIRGDRLFHPGAHPLAAEMYQLIRPGKIRRKKHIHLPP